MSARQRGELAEEVKTFLLSDWRALAGGSCHGLKSFAASLRKNWELAALAVCAVSVLVVALQLLGELPSEKAVPDDLPGFYTGGYYSSYDTKPVRYGLYIPPRFAADDAGRSLIVSMDDFGQPAQSLQHGLASAIRGRVKSGADFSFAVFFPAHPKGRWATSEKVHSIMEALDHVVARHRIDPKRVYLAGHAQGSCAAWDLAAACPERWAAVVAVSPTCMPNSYEADGIARARIPCWIFKGAFDKHAPAAGDLARALQEAKGEMRQTQYPTSGRDFWHEVYGPKLLTWLAQKSR